MSDALDPATIPLFGVRLVEASAGTGKTHAIATLFVRALVELELGVDEILVVTFTEAAAAELRDRIRGRLRAAIGTWADPAAASDPDLARLAATRRDAGRSAGDLERLVASLRAFDLASISTIHGFCQRVLHTSAFETGVPLSTELVTDETTLFDTAVRDYWARELYGADPIHSHHLLREKVTPSRLLSLARTAMARPDIEIVPKPADPGALPELAPYAAAYRRLRAVWVEHREPLAKLLLGTPKLNRVKYKVDRVGEWLAKISAFLRPDEAMWQLDVEEICKFTPTAIAAGMKAGNPALEHAFFTACGELAQARAPIVAYLDAWLMSLKLGLVDWVRKELPRRKRAAQQTSFDDLLQLLCAALRRRTVGKRLAEQIRRRYRAALIDEFQDTDPTQYEIFQRVFAAGDSPLLLIGDPKQAIYAFRGADVYSYLEAGRAAVRRRTTMRHNWRSDPALVRAIDHLFSVADPFLVEGIEMPHVEARPGATARLFGRDGAPLPAFELAMCPNPEPKPLERSVAIADIAARVAADISRLLASGAVIRDGAGERPVHAGDIAVLSRSNAQAQIVQAALRELAIPSVVYGDATVFATPEAGELAHVLAAAAEPTQDRLLRAALATELVGVTADRLLRMDAEAIGAAPATHAEDGWDHWVDVFRRLHELWSGRGFVQMFRALLVETGAQARLLALGDGERRMTNLLHLAELLHEHAAAEHLGPAGLLRWYDDQRNANVPTIAEAYKLRLERDERAVQLITIHRSKGLEWPIVYCPFLWGGENLFGNDREELVYHDPARGHRAVLDLRSKDDPDKRVPISCGEHERRAEGLRLAYVAVTRARHRCVVVWGRISEARRSALGYLLHAPQVGEPARSFEDIGKKMALDDDASVLAQLQARGGSEWTVRVLDDAAGAPWRPALRVVPTLVCREPRSAIDRAFRTSSFSHMAAAATTAPLFVDFADARAHDEALHPDLSFALPARPAGPNLPLADFPRGIRAGNFFHDLLEHLDFTAPEPVAHRLVLDKLRAHGYPDALAESVQPAL
ncbi:MAG TPA: UvrD-helicase domain-containing protein, partial [Nannocystaceae bacterium]|nr:UvrD-helicase domain-containing protein [Nannocystaceae bacterium]